MCAKWSKFLAFQGYMAHERTTGKHDSSILTRHTKPDTRDSERRTAYWSKTPKQKGLLVKLKKLTVLTSAPISSEPLKESTELRKLRLEQSDLFQSTYWVKSQAVLEFRPHNFHQCIFLSTQKSSFILELHFQGLFFL